MLACDFDAIYRHIPLACSACDRDAEQCHSLVLTRSHGPGLDVIH